MIIAFNPTIFDTEDPDLRKYLAEIIILIVEKEHFIDFKNSYDVFFKDGMYHFNHHPIAKIFFSNHASITIQNAFDIILRKTAYITQLHQNYLTQITIGHQAGEISPAIAYKMLSERSKLIVENGINDWKFIESVCQKYTSHKARGTIYKLIKKAMLWEHLEPENAGGHGGMVKIITKWMENRYKDIALYKLMVLFDSDKTSKTMFSKSHDAKIAFLKGKKKENITDDDYHKYESSDIIHWHMLYKRKLENYVPLSVLFKHLFTINESQLIDLQAKTNDELDFIEYGKDNIGLHKDKTKDQFPELFGKEFSYADLENWCNHHKVTIQLPYGTMIQVSELEQILLKIAKII